ncbi:hypothetical protein FGO68_gene4652 [Halteria grandinella]|uniref:PhoD-like phosphatase metallophosphatase domain-containing protein n=1 Tax=Halteria grandinella TaxID=5974 RepID=A0A8J8NF87_HALGN|nr:hypothetical protein FGO68_gene4652 [Halteria grandinella]
MYVHKDDRRELLMKTVNNQYYSKFVREKMPVIGVWDDHDYGVNDGDSTSLIKNEQRSMYLDALEVPPTGDVRRDTRKDEGLYFYQIVQKGGFKVLIVMFDVRFHKTDEDTLGEKQWLWFSQVLEANRDANVILLGSGTQYMMGNRLFNAEKWHNREVKRLLDTIDRYIHPRTPLVLLSGDVHHAQFLNLGCVYKERKVLEMTSSGITHTCERNLKGFCTIALKGNTPDKFQASEIIVEFNYGLIEIDLEHQSISLKIMGLNQKVLLEHHIPIENPRMSPPGSKYCENRSFVRSQFWFEAVACHFTEAMIVQRNKFLIFGITGTITGVSLIIEGIRNVRLYFRLVLGIIKRWCKK